MCGRRRPDATGVTLVLWFPLAQNGTRGPQPATHSGPLGGQPALALEPHNCGWADHIGADARSKPLGRRRRRPRDAPHPQ
jgi:hypothetical protein